MTDPVEIEVPGVGRVWLVPDEAAVARLQLRRGACWTPGETALLAGWAPAEARVVAEAKALLDGRLRAATGPTGAPAGGPSAPPPPAGPPGELPLDPARVRAWLPRVRVFVEKLQAAGKKDRKASVVPDEDTVLAKALECEVVQQLGGTPDLTVRRGNDGGTDGQLADGRRYEVKACVVRAAWDGPQGFNSIRATDGRVRAALLVAAMVTRQLDRAAILGYALRGDRMVRMPGFDRPAYLRARLRDVGELKGAQ